MICIVTSFIMLLSIGCSEENGELVLLVISPKRMRGQYSDNLYIFDKNDAESFRLIESNLRKKKSRIIHVSKDKLKEVNKSLYNSVKNEDVDYVIYAFIKSELSIAHTIYYLDSSGFVEFLSVNSEVFGDIDYFQGLIGFHRG